jgi:hypothetical protein
VLEVEPAVFGRDLCRVDHLTDLVVEGRSRTCENVAEKARSHLGRPLVDDTGIVFHGERKRLLCGDRACVELLHELDDRHARLVVARHESRARPGGTPPTRQTATGAR